jgi:hypothetical protein
MNPPLAGESFRAKIASRSVPSISSHTSNDLADVVLYCCGRWATAQSAENRWTWPVRKRIHSGKQQSATTIRWTIRLEAAVADCSSDYIGTSSSSASSATTKQPSSMGTGRSKWVTPVAYKPWKKEG